jgi:hypothetical protein
LVELVKRSSDGGDSVGQCALVDVFQWSWSFQR